MTKSIKLKPTNLIQLKMAVNNFRLPSGLYKLAIILMQQVDLKSALRGGGTTNTNARTQPKNELRQ